MLVDGPWVGALFALFVGTLLALASFAIGEDMSHGLHSAYLYRDQKRRRTGGEALDRSISSSPEEPAGVPNDAKLKTAADIGLCVSSALLGLLFVGALVGYIVDTGSTFRRRLWLSVLLAPTGALCRWQLARLNTQHIRLPIGTLVANVVACALDAVLAALLVRVSLSSSEEVVLRALITGTGGTLSTVSTWVGEIRLLRKEGGYAAAWAYLYVFVSIGMAQAVGVLIYGLAVWTR